MKSLRPDISLRVCQLAVVTFVAVLAIAGGASREDDVSQIVVRVAAIAAGALIAALQTAKINRRDIQVPFGFVMAIAAIILIQLLPLPPALWTRLPGRAFGEKSYVLANIPLGWHPINLTPDQGLSAALSLLPVGCTLILLSALARARTQALLTIVIVAVASSFVGLFQLGSESSQGLPSGFFANRNHQALFLACAIPALALWLTKQRTTLASYVVAGALTIFIVLLIALTGSRSGLLTTLIGILGSVYFFRGQILTPRSPRAAIVIVASLIAVSTIGIAAFFSGKLVILQRLMSMDSTGDMRVRVLRPLLDMVANYFPIGSGFGSFDSEFRHFERVQDLTFDYFNHAHNDFIEAAVEGGLPAIFLMMLFALWWASSTVRIWRSARDSDTDFARLGTFISGMILVASSIDYPARTPLIACLFTLSCYWMHYVLARSHATGPLVRPAPAMDTFER